MATRSFLWMSPRTARAKLTAIVWLVSLVSIHPLWAQAGRTVVVEQDSFRLYWVSRAVGMEHYQVLREGENLLTTVEFEFTDRGTTVPLSAELVTTEDYTPSRLIVKGKVARRVRGRHL